MPRNLTDFTFFYNAPLQNFNDTIHFQSNEERDRYFLNDGHFPTFTFETPFNFVRDRLELNVHIEYGRCAGINYGTFLSEFEPDTRYYFYVVRYEYINDHTTKFYLQIDTLMTFTQGTVIEDNATAVHINRQHLPDDYYHYFLNGLRNNDDVLKQDNKLYRLTKFEPFNSSYVLWQSSADLTVKFGTKRDPNLESSHGSIYDRITSPVDLYLCDYQDFNNIMKKLSKFPWITQNFQKIQMIPKKFFDPSDIVEVETEEDIGTIYTLKDSGTSNNWELEELETSIDELGALIGFDINEHKHLIRNEYITLELYNYDGQALYIDAGYIPFKRGLRFNSRSIIGYYNEVRVYPEHYKSDKNENVIRNGYDDIVIDKGAYLNEVITFDNFTKLPILIDTAVLGQAQNANQRALNESRLITNRAKNLVDPTSSAKSKFFDATSILSNLNPTQLFSKINEDYEFYRDQQAEFKDMALSPNTLTPSESGNSFNLANGMNGLTLKIGMPTYSSWVKIIKYYNMFGYSINEQYASVLPIDSMSVCNYLKFDGYFQIPGIDNALMEQMRSLFEIGVRFWKNNGSSNPLLQDVTKNKRVK